MNKSDVIFKVDNIQTMPVNMQALQKSTLLTPLPFAKDIKRSINTIKNSKSYKKPYLKVGFVNNDLFLRIKDGSKHLADVKLKAGYKVTYEKAKAKLTSTRSDEEKLDGKKSELMKKEASKPKRIKAYEGCDSWAGQVA